MTETFYDALGVAEDASTEEIERAYRSAVKEVHPDVNDDADAEERTKRLNRAKEVLTDDAERARYDRLGHAAYTGEEADSGDADESERTADRSGTDVDWDEATSSGADRTRAGRTSGGSGRAGSAENPWKRSGPQRSESRTGASRSARSSSASTAAAREHATASRTRQTHGPDRDSRRGSRAARRQAAAGVGDANADASWNAWESTRAWAVRQEASGSRGLGLSRFASLDQSIVLVFSIFFLYPVFVASALYPPFPTVARLLLAVCTLFVVTYLLSFPEIGLFVFGVWGVVAPVAILSLPGVSVFSLIGVAALTATWMPFGLTVLTLSIVDY